MGPFDLRCWELLDAGLPPRLRDAIDLSHKFLVSGGAWQSCWEAGNDLIARRVFRLPFSAVTFEFSDNLPNDHDLEEFADIAKLLLHRGADPKTRHANRWARYEPFNPDAEQSPFMPVWQLTANTQ